MTENEDKLLKNTSKR